MIIRLLRIVIVLEALTFFLGALLHSGVEFSGLSEPKITPIAVIEILCGLFLSLSVYQIGWNKKNAWRTAVIAHIFSIVGVMTGILVLTSGRGPITEFNYFHHRILLAILVIMVVLLLMRRTIHNPL
jgi:hypothetical protein